MSSSQPPSPPRRADAERSRVRLLQAANEEFFAKENPTLDAIANRAGVGIGTLYRHFPTRGDLVEAVYSTELARLCDSAADLLDVYPPAQALRAWMGRYNDFVATKRGMSDALRVLATAGTVTRSQTAPRLSSAIDVILRAGVAAGTLRDDVSADDITAAMTGTLLVAGGADQQPQAQRLLTLIVDGLIK